MNLKYVIFIFFISCNSGVTIPEKEGLLSRVSSTKALTTSQLTTQVTNLNNTISILQNQIASLKADNINQAKFITDSVLNRRLSFNMNQFKIVNGVLNLK